MARRARRNRTERVATLNARRPNPYDFTFRLHRFAPPQFTFIPDDRRRWHPERLARPASIIRPAARLVARDTRLHPLWDQQTKATIAFADPPRVSVCRRRQQRKEVIHAKGVAGGRVRPPRRNEFSDVSCKR